ncbi:cell cycle control protein, putative, partial [Eimeria tenella]
MRRSRGRPAAQYNQGARRAFQRAIKAARESPPRRAAAAGAAAAAAAAGDREARQQRSSAPRQKQQAACCSSSSSSRRGSCCCGQRRGGICCAENKKSDGRRHRESWCGVYVPPFKLARLQQQTSDSKSHAYQRQMWEALRKSINGLVNKANVSNLTQLVQELFRENLVRGRGLFCRALIRSQLASPGFTGVYASLLCIVNSKLPDIGELVLKRLILQFRRAYRRNDKVVCLACVEFFAHLVNQRIAHELLALQLCELLLQQPTNDSVEVCIGFLKDVCRGGFDAAFERLRAILQEGEIDKKTQYSIEALWDIRRKGFKDFPGVIEELDLVEAEDKITHEVDLLDSSIRGEEMLNIFKPQDPEEYEADEKKWAALSREILGEESTDADASSEDSEAESSSEEEAEETAEPGKKQTVVKDLTDQEVVCLRKTIYLCIMSSLNAEECVHKILKMNIQEDLEMEVAVMLIDCCSMERTFQRFFALQAERLAKLKTAYCECFQEAFKRQYALAHRLETAKLRNTAKFFAHLLMSDAIPWSVLEVFELSEEQTTSSGRIFLKVLLQEISEGLGIKTLNERLRHPDLKPYVK